MGAYLGNSKKLKLMINNVAFKIYSGKIVNCVHEYSSTVISPTCTTQGYTKNSCSLCGNTYNSNYVPQLGHTIVIIPGKEATATAPGLTDGQKCSVCGKILKEQVEIPITHVHSSAYRTENRIEATCTNNGSYDHVEYCTSCYEVLNRTNNSIPATGHSWGEWITDKEATEYDNGSKHRVCDTCSEEETATIPALGHTHSYTSTVIAPTCEEGGYTLYTCSCNDSYTANPTPATGHTWGSWIVDKAATETAEGSQHRECANCDEVETETIPKTTHVHVAGEAKEENRVAATCDADGKYDLVVRCTGCGNIISSETKTIPATGHTPGAAATCTTAQTCTVCHTVLKAATGHTEVIDDAVEATCTSTGLTVGKHCSVCNATLIAQQVVPVKSHTGGEPVEENREEPTCTTDGSYNEVTYCSVCNTKMGSVLVTIPSPGHDDSNNSDNRCDICGAILCTDNNHVLVTIPGKAATCTSTGLTDGQKCSACSKIIIAQQVIDKLEHDYVVIKNGLAASCVSDGYTDTLECSMCNDTIASRPIEAFGHDWESGEYPCTCARCGLHDPEYESEESSGKCIHCGLECKHDFSNLIMDEVSPTCTEAGYTAVYECGHCGIRDGGDEISALGHIYDESAPEEDICLCTRCHKYIHNLNGCKCADCGAHVPIDEDNNYICDDCGESLCDEHDWVTSEEEVAPTCIEPGRKAIRNCGVCGVAANDSGDEIEALGHEFNEAASEEDICLCTRCHEYIHNTEGEKCECTDCGAHVYIDIDNDYRCDICGESICDEHDYHTVVEASEPTCLEPGYTEVQECGHCGDRIGGEETSPALGHDWLGNMDAVDPTCEEEGHEETETCTRCNITQGGAIIYPTGHQYGDSTIENEVAATCDTQGSYDTVWRCTECNIVLESSTSYTDILGHDPGETVIENYEAPGCETYGTYDEVVYCTRCGDELERHQGQEDPIGHDWETKEEGYSATCTEPGQYTSYFCGNCGESKGGGVIPETGHEYGPVVTENEVAPGCEENGSHDEVQYCTVCDEELSRETITDYATGHLEGESVIENSYESSCTEHGSYDTVWYCQYCGTELQRTTETLELAPHNLITVNENEQEADCTNWGSYDAVVKCSVCDAEIERHTEYTDKPLEHDYIGDMNDIPATCEEDGKKETETCTRCGDIIGGETIPATGHTSDSGSIENEVAATCDTQGSYDTVWRCVQCGITLESSTSYTDILGHSGGGTVIEEGSKPGCETWGTNYEVVYCTRCGDELERHEVPVEPTGHDYLGNMDAVDPTCTKAGKEETETCTRCGDTIGGATIPATGHISEYDPCVCDDCGAPTHDYDSDDICTQCGYSRSELEGDACLIASTPILMADGTEKAISEVQAGDMVKSWDLDNNEYVDVEVLGSYRTGDATDWLVYSFDNGKELTIYDQHNIYCKENNSIKKSTYWKPDQTAITLDGNETTYCGVVDSETPEKVSRHTLVTENNLYFANGILCGHHARAKYKFFTKDLLEANLEQAAQFKETFDIYQAMNGTENAEYRKEAAELIENIRAAKRNVKDRNSKFAKDAGKLHKKQTNKKLKEIKQFNSEADTFKVDIKTINKDIRKSRKELNKLKEKYGVSTKTIYECWKEAYDLDMKYLKEKAAE